MFAFLFCSLFALLFFVLIETKRNEATANDDTMNITTKPRGPMMPIEAVAASSNTHYMRPNFGDFCALINKSFHENEFTNMNCTKSVTRSLALSASNTTSSLRSSSTCSSMFENTTTVPNNTDLFFTQQPKSSQSLSCYTHNKRKTNINPLLNTLTISSEDCTRCHFIQDFFVNLVNNQPADKLYFYGNEIVAWMWKCPLPNVKIPTAPVLFNMKEVSIVNNGYSIVESFMFYKMFKLCYQNLYKQEYGINFGSVIQLRIIMHLKEKISVTTFAPVLIKLTESKKNSSSSDQFSKCAVNKMNSYQKSNHLIGIKIKPGTVTILNGRSTANINVKIGFCFDESLANQRLAMQYACIDHLQQKDCYRTACKDAEKAKRQNEKWVKRNHILLLQTEKRNSSYTPVLFLKKDEKLAETIAKIQSRIYFKHLPNCLFELFVTIE